MLSKALEVMPCVTDEPCNPQLGVTLTHAILPSKLQAINDITLTRQTFRLQH